MDSFASDVYRFVKGDLHADGAFCTSAGADWGMVLIDQPHLAFVLVLNTNCLPITN
jgi:hypothetical protein